VRAEQRDGRIMISVADRGPGIPPEQQKGLFERFYRAASSAEEPGVGLGLAIVKGIIEAHGGAVGFESAPGAGTRVWMLLPPAQEEP
jgi:signal transduction histidine kinase